MAEAAPFPSWRQDQRVGLEERPHDLAGIDLSCGLAKPRNDQRRSSGPGVAATLDGVQCDLGHAAASGEVTNHHMRGKPGRDRVSLAPVASGPGLHPFIWAGGPGQGQLERDIENEVLQAEGQSAWPNGLEMSCLASRNERCQEIPTSGLARSAPSIRSAAGGSWRPVLADQMGYQLFELLPVWLGCLAKLSAIHLNEVGHAGIAGQVGDDQGRH